MMARCVSMNERGNEWVGRVNGSNEGEGARSRPAKWCRGGAFIFGLIFAKFLGRTFWVERC